VLYIPDRALESPLSPIVILATNRGRTAIRGTDNEVISSHGIPVDLLDRLIIVRTFPYQIEDVKEIVMIRANTEDTKLDENAADRLASIGMSASLRFAVQLLSPAKILAQASGRDLVTVDDVKEAATLFLDAKQSARILAQHSEKYLM